MAWSLPRLQDLMPKIVLADNREVIHCNDSSLYMLGDDLSRVSHHILVSVAPTVPQLSRILDDVVVRIPERFLQDWLRGLRRSPTSNDPLQNTLRVIEHSSRFCASTGPEERLGIAKLSLQLLDPKEAHSDVDVSVEVGELRRLPSPTRHGHQVNIAEGSRLSSCHTSVNHYTYHVRILSLHKNHGTLRRLIEESVQLAVSEICQ